MEKTKKIIYDELCAVLTDYEEGEANGDDLYKMLVDIQNSWERTITSQDN